MTGALNYMLRVIGPDIAGYEHFITGTLMRVGSVKDIRSSFSVSRALYGTDLPMKMTKTR